MKIKNRLYMSAGISIVLVVILFSLVLMLSGRIVEGNRRHELLDSVRGSIVELDLVTYDYLLYREERMEQQWNSRYGSLREILEKSMEEDELISIYADYVALGDLFSQVTANNEKIQKLTQAGAFQEKTDAAIALEGRLVTQLLMTSYSVITDISRRAEGVQTEVMESQRLGAILTIILMAILAITVGGSSLLVVRSISKPLDKLTKGAEIIGTGDLEHKVEIQSKDELGQLADAFNKMTGDLFKDRTERKQMEEQLRHSQLLASLGEMTAGIAHEVGNPLASIVLYSGLAMKSDISRQTRKDLKVIHNEAKRAGRVMRDLLDYSHKLDPKMYRLNMHSIIKKVLDMRRYQQKVHNITVSTNLRRGPLYVNGDSSQLTQVFINLILNAEDALRESKGRNIVVTTQTDGNWAKVSIADNGTGIAEENLSRVFHPFFSTKQVGEGTGLGLSTCYGIITAHGGLVRAENNDMSGATFTVELPLANTRRQGRLA